MKLWTYILPLILFSGCTHKVTREKDPKVKNVILMIGDGMGPGQISLLNYFIKNSRAAKKKNIKYAFERFKSGSIGISETAPYDKIVVDSACSATQLATGMSSRSEMIGLDIHGNTAKTILEKAQARGLATGLVSDTRITHATPASFASHVANRWSEDEIAKGLIEVAPDVLFSGGANRFYPQKAKKNIGPFTIQSKRKDDKNLIDDAKLKNYQILHEKSDFKNIDENKKLLGLFANHNFPDAIWFNKEKNNPKRAIPNLLEMSQVAIKKLSQNKKGFFLMIEGGQIDWAAHRNDAGTMLHEMLSFNETINWVIDWTEKHPDTLLVVTADHETGGFGIGYNMHNPPKGKNLQGLKFQNKLFKPLLNYGDYEILDNLYSQEKSFKALWKEFKGKSKKNQTAKVLQTMVQRNSHLRISLKRAKDIMKNAPNPFKVKGHDTLGVDELAKFHGQQEFYFNTYNGRLALIGRALAPQQNIVWGTGGHTASDVHVYSLGKKDVTNKFSGLQTHIEIGKKLQEVLNL